MSEVVSVCGSSQAKILRYLLGPHKVRILSRWKEGVTVYYAAADDATLEICQTACIKIAEEMY